MHSKRGPFAPRTLAIAACLISACLAPAWGAQRCASFASFDEGTPLSEKYRQRGFRFDFGDQSTQTFDHAAIFWGEQNPSVKTPYAGKKIHLEIKPHTAAWISVQAIDANGNVAGSFDQGPPYPNPLIMNFESAEGNLVRVNLQGGGNESGIARICVKRD